MAPRLTLVGLLVAAMVLCHGSGRTVEGAAAGLLAAERSEAQTLPDQRPANVVHFRPYSSVDNQGLGIAAFHMLVPDGWRVEGGVRWRLDNPAFPAFGSLRVSNPEKLQELEIFPNLPTTRISARTCAGSRCSNGRNVASGQNQRSSRLL